MQGSLFPVSPVQTHPQDRITQLEARLAHAERIIDSAAHYVRSTPTQKPVLTHSMRELIEAYKSQYGISLCYCDTLPKHVQCNHCHTKFSKGPRRG